MNQSIALIALMLIAGSHSAAGELFGTVKEEGKALPKGVKVEVVSLLKTYSTETDNYGSYRLYIPEKGKCTLKLIHKKQTPTLDIFSYEKSTRYDLLLETKDGKLTLRRK